MDIMMTKALATISQALSPLLGTGVGAAASAAGASAATAAAGAVAVAAGASTAGLSSAHAPLDKPTAHAVSRMAKSFFMMQLPLQGIGAGFPGADADGLFQIEHEDLAVTDLAGAGGLFDGLDGLVEQIGSDGRNP